MADRDTSDLGRTVPGKLPPGIIAVGIFLFFGATMASLAGATLVWRGTALDKIWVLNPTAYRQLAPIGRTVGTLFLVLSATMTLAAIGWFKRRRWGWVLAAGIIITQMLGDFINFLRRDFVRGGTGFVIAAALLLYLLSSSVRTIFVSPKSPRR
jgi:hypothetical protein